MSRQRVHLSLYLNVWIKYFTRMFIELNWIADFIKRSLALNCFKNIQQIAQSYNRIMNASRYTIQFILLGTKHRHVQTNIRAQTQCCKNILGKLYIICLFTYKRSRLTVCSNYWSHSTTRLAKPMRGNQRTPHKWECLLCAMEIRKYPMKNATR